MMHQLLPELQAAIDKNLPSAVGDTLKARLLQLEVLEKKVADLTNSVAYKESMVNDLLKKVQRDEAAAATATSLASREKALVEREFKAAVSELRVELCKERLDDMRGLVQAVFANNRFKYSESSLVPVPLPGHNPGNGYGSTSPTVVTSHATRQVEGEGAPGA